ncbi:signal peptidase I SipW [Alkalibacillus haloalkaliphilus]|uniref:signal peptidase I SipW n=1 Tax=Alkalibacillus haloalkaliphilus TaxID=94136 RepID=UPI0002DC03E7|nr:signal peptidase I [Alkalibacillus haloalkaliphilus]
MKVKMKTVKKVTSSVLSFTLILAVVLMAVTVISVKASGGEPEIFGYQIKTVLSGSMEPEFQTGSVIAVIPDGDMTRFVEGDVITFMEEDRLVTHRVVDVVESGDNVMYETKGDNNNAPDRDLVLSDNVVAEYTGFTIPYVGYIASFAQSQLGGALMLILPGLLLMGYAGYAIWQGVSQLESNNKKKEEKTEKAETPA